MSHILYVDNTGYIQLQGYKNGLTNEYINDAVVTVEITNQKGDLITGLLPVINMNYEVGSNGNYSASISENAEFNSNDILNAKVTAISSGVQSVFNCRIIIKQRGC